MTAMAGEGLATERISALPEPALGAAVETRRELGPGLLKPVCETRLKDGLERLARTHSP